MEFERSHRSSASDFIISSIPDYKQKKFVEKFVFVEKFDHFSKKKSKLGSLKKHDPDVNWADLGLFEGDLHNSFMILLNYMPNFREITWKVINLNEKKLQ